MKILMVHQNFPGQFKHLTKALIADPGNEVVAFTMNQCQPIKGLKLIHYTAMRGTSRDIHPWVAETETKVIRGDAALRAAQRLSASGFSPDVIIAHPGWGESLFLKQVWPQSRLIIYCEFYYGVDGTDAGFDPEFPNHGLELACRLQLKNVNNLMHFEIADAGISPTKWQQSTYPLPFRNRITIVHDGINTATVKPDPDAWIEVDGIRFSRSDEVITFVNRNLEPHRGYHSFMRALPELLKKRPNAHVLIVGGDDVSYGARPPKGNSWKEIFLDEVSDRLDLSRVHFMGHLAYTHFIPLLQISTVHVYLTYPFILSWSLLEAMACSCAIVASNTEPVREVIQDGKNGVLVDFFQPDDIAHAVIRMLENPSLRQQLGTIARKTIIRNYDLNSVCLPKLMKLIKKMAE